MTEAMIKDIRRTLKENIDSKTKDSGAAVCLIIPARRGKFHREIFRIADSLLTDRDDLVQKGYGWMLKAASQADEKGQCPEQLFVMRLKKCSLS